MTFDRHANLEYLSIGTGTFGPEDIIIDTVGQNKKQIAE